MLIYAKFDEHEHLCSIGLFCQNEENVNTHPSNQDRVRVTNKMAGSETSDTCRPLMCEFCETKCCKSEQLCVCDPFSCSLPSVIRSPNLISHRILGSLLLLPARGIGIILGLLTASIVSKLAIVGLTEAQIQKQVCSCTDMKEMVDVKLLYSVEIESFFRVSNHSRVMTKSLAIYVQNYLTKIWCESFEEIVMKLAVTSSLTSFPGP